MLHQRSFVPAGFHQYVAEIARLFTEAHRLRPTPSTVTPDGGSGEGPTALVFAPHPDDECVMGALALRLAREAGYRVVAVAVTLGSREDRREARRREMRAACTALGFGLHVPASAAGGGLRAEHRGASDSDWEERVGELTDALRQYRPRLVLVPHADDGHGAHMATHHLVRQALERWDRSCWVVETEFWRAQAAPDLLVASSVTDVGDLVHALALHAGEVARNPYHLRLPAWLQDNVRRGAELVAGHGAAAPEVVFGTLYRRRLWHGGEPTAEPPGSGRKVPGLLDLSDDPARWFPEPKPGMAEGSAGREINP